MSDCKEKLRGNGKQIVKIKFELERQVLGNRLDKIKLGYESE